MKIRPELVDNFGEILAVGPVFAMNDPRIQNWIAQNLHVQYKKNFLGQDGIKVNLVQLMEEGQDERQLLQE